MDLPKIKSVVPNAQGDRLLLLRVSNEGTDPRIFFIWLILTGQACKPAELTPEAREYLKAESVELTTYTLELDYDYWSTGEHLCISHMCY